MKTGTLRAIAHNMADSLGSGIGLPMGGVYDLNVFTEALNRRIVVTVCDRLGRCYVDEYIGTPARRIKVADRLGRIRTQRKRPGASITGMGGTRVRRP